MFSVTVTPKIGAKLCHKNRRFWLWNGPFNGSRARVLDFWSYVNQNWLQYRGGEVLFGCSRTLLYKKKIKKRLKSISNTEERLGVQEEKCNETISSVLEKLFICLKVLEQLAYAFIKILTCFIFEKKSASVLFSLHNKILIEWTANKVIKKPAFRMFGT